MKVLWSQNRMPTFGPTNKQRCTGCCSQIVRIFSCYSRPPNTLNKILFPKFQIKCATSIEGWVIIMNQADFEPPCTTLYPPLHCLWGNNGSPSFWTLNIYPGLLGSWWYSSGKKSKEQRQCLWAKEWNIEALWANKAPGLATGQL